MFLSKCALIIEKYLDYTFLELHNRITLIRNESYTNNIRFEYSKQQSTYESNRKEHENQD